MVASFHKQYERRWEQVRLTGFKNVPQGMIEVMSYEFRFLTKLRLAQHWGLSLEEIDNMSYWETDIAIQAMRVDNAR